MADYRCYFLGPTETWHGIQRSIEAAEDLSAVSDEDALAIAQRIYRNRLNQIHGFELWQGTRMVHHHAGTS